MSNRELVDSAIAQVNRELREELSLLRVRPSAWRNVYTYTGRDEVVVHEGPWHVKVKDALAARYRDQPKDGDVYATLTSVIERGVT